MPNQGVLGWLGHLAGPFEPGTVCLIGAGPGDPTLISVRGAVRIAQADVILYDTLVERWLLALADPAAELVFVGKQAGRHSLPQTQINRLLVEHAGRNARVARLKGGDPFVFGRGGEECEALAAHKIRFEVIPGITAAIAAPAYAGIPVTHRDMTSTFALVTGHEDPTKPTSGVDFGALARIGTIALYMSVKNLAANCRQLIGAGLDPHTPAAVIHRGTLPAQRTVTGTIADIADRAVAAGIAAPAMTLIGRAVGLRDKLAWFEARPLFGHRIIVTRSRHQASELAGRLMQLGAEAIEAPTITIEPLDDYARIDQALRRLSDYNWLVLTSVNGVDAALERMRRLDMDARLLFGVRIAAIGPATAERLRDHLLKPDLVAETFTSESLAEALSGFDLTGQRCLLLRADVAGADLPAALIRSGAICDDLAIYRTARAAALPEPVLERLGRGEIDWITFASSSTFLNFVALLGEDRLDLLAEVKLASIGPVTSRAIRQRGFEPTVEAQPHTIPALVDAIRAHAERNRTGKN